MRILLNGLNGWALASLILLAQASATLIAEEAPDPAQLIKKLSADNFDERNAAFTTLENLGEDARKALETALTANPTTEARSGIERLLKKLPPKRALYAKLLLPGNAPDGAERYNVESWIAKDLKLEDGSALHAVSDWCLLTENASTRFLTVIQCNIPVSGRVERKSGKFEAVFTIHGPAPVNVHGNVVNDEMGQRAVSSIGKKERPHAFVALLVGPEPRQAAGYQKVPGPKEKEEVFKP